MIDFCWNCFQFGQCLMFIHNFKIYKYLFSSIIVQSKENFSIFDPIELIDRWIKQPAWCAASTRPISSSWLCSTFNEKSETKNEKERRGKSQKINKYYVVVVAMAKYGTKKEEKNKNKNKDRYHL